MIMDVVKRAVGFLLLALVAILLLKLVIGAVIGFVKTVILFALLGVFAFAALALWRR
jgi:hypothetical protein